MNILSSDLNVLESELLQEPAIAAQRLLHQASQKAVFETQLREAFGSLFDGRIGVQLTEEIAQARYDWPTIEVLGNDELQGAAGAYAAQTRTIYLSADFVQANAIAAPENILAVLLEEVGHDLDAQLNPGGDAPGDEGEIFSALLRGQALDGAQLNELRSQNDHASIVLNGIETDLELATTLAAGSGQPISNRDPYSTLNYAIALQGTFPSRNLSTEPVLGAVMQFAGTFAPRGWALADGQLLSVNQNQALFSILGTTYGGDGRTTFALPDLRGRVPVGAGNGPGLDNVSLGQKLGSETTTLTLNNLPSHSHNIPGQTRPTSTVGGSQSFSTLAPSLGLNPVITVEGLFPSRNLSTDPFIGSIDWFAGNFAPRGTLFAHGQLLPIAEYSTLFSLLGTIYGGDGRTTFALPDLRGRTPVHYGSGPGLPSIALGQSGGSNTVTLTQQNLAAHSHSLPGQTGGTASTGANQSFSNRQPFLGVNYQIAQFGVFPARDNLEAERPGEPRPVEDSDFSGLIVGDNILESEAALKTVNDLAQAGIDQWVAAGISPAQRAQLESVTYEITNLESGNLAFAGTDNAITIDADASNRGWFVDTTPEEHSEFGSTDPRTGEWLATEADAISHFDLFTVILHEQGHILGLSHTPEPGSVMYGALGTGGRLLPQAADLAAVELEGEHSEHEYSDHEHSDHEHSDHEHSDSPYLSASSQAIAGVGMFAGDFPIRGFASTNGQLISTSQNDALFSLIGTIYGGDGRTTFGLPDLRGRAVAHAGTGPGLSTLRLGEKGGFETTTLSLATLPNHSHEFEINTAPSISGSPATTVAEDSAYSFIPTVVDPDTGDTQTFSIQNQPAWASFNTSTGELSGTPNNDAVGATEDVIIRVTDGISEAVALAAFNLTVTNTNDDPSITGTPETSVAEDSAYSFTPTVTDPDIGDTTTFSIQNQPAWASFNTATGELSGTPDNDAVGTTQDIVISVADGANTTTSLGAFNLTVTNTNDQPTILGSPATTVAEDSPYSFTPTVTDPDVGDTATFAIQNQPTWASFNTTTGELSGTPDNDAVGTTQGISISVTDSGLSTSAIPAFDLTVTNTNDPPTGDVTLSSTTATQGVTLTASNNLADADGIGSLNYQWQQSSNGSDWSNIVDATSDNFTPSDAQVRQQLRLEVSYTDNRMAMETVYSDTTTIVANVDDPAEVAGDRSGAGDEDQNISGTLTATDVEGLTDGSYFSIETNGQASHGNATIDPASGAWLYRPEENFNGSDAFTVTVTDDIGGITTQAIDITVNAVNDTPTFIGQVINSLRLSPLSTTEIGLTIDDIDSDLADLTLSVTNTTNSTFLPLGNATISGNGRDRTLTIIPSGVLFQSEAQLTLQLSDGDRSENQTIDFVLYNTQPDFNRDNFGDLLWVNQVTGGIVQWSIKAINNQPESVSRTFINADSAVGWDVVDSLDFNNDGHRDILMRNHSTDENKVLLLNGLNQTNAVSIGANRPIANMAWQMKAAGNFDSDAETEILWRNLETGGFALWDMDGNDATANFVDLTAIGLTAGNALPLKWEIQTTGDFDGDGKDEVLWRNTENGSNAIWTMNGSELVSSAFLPQLSNLEWSMIGTSDFDLNGTMDIAWRNAMTGQNAIWQMTQQGDSYIQTDSRFIPNLTNTDWTAV